MGDRIKKLRKTLNLTQQEFANRLQIGRGTLANYEVGRNDPIDAVISLICREFNVTEAWLRTGDGEMFLDTPDNVLDALVEKYGLSYDARILVEEFVNLKPEVQQVFIDYARKAAAAFRSMDEDDSPDPPAAQQRQLTELAAPEPEDEDAAIKAEARKKADAYYEQLLLKASVRTSGASTPAKTG